LFHQAGEEEKKTEDLSAQIESYAEASVALAETLSQIHNAMISGEEYNWVRVEACMREYQCCLALERNSLLLDGIFTNPKSRPEEGMRFCDQLKSDLTQLVELEETTEEFKNAMTVYFNVALNCRAYFLALCHFGNEKYLDAAALLDLMQRLDKDLVLDELEAPLKRIRPIFQDINLKTLAAGTRLYTRTLVALHKSSATTVEDKGVATKAVTTFPPGPCDVECKPFLFDLAFAYLEPPDISHLVQKKGLVSKMTGVLGSWGNWGKKK